MSLRFAVLGLLAQEGGSGYDLLRRFDSTVAHVWPATQSQLYAELGKLTDERLIEVVGVGARNRKEYVLTDTGRGELKNWLRHPVREAPRRAGLLQVFLLSETDSQGAKAFFSELEERARAKRDELLSLENSIAWDSTPQDRFARMTLEYGVRQAGVEAEWAREMSEQLDA